ncbi:hypothetical protein B296_00007839 [Ensete ventricosum]|uniref:Uncharacterized protein n=1 Tax=Ensete ventricosum TaxID=4639 RepID=A0A426ZV44_ENSVE|nr:hypothetical protein B296_00007839 [Ensete ventricosum]
MRKAYARSSIEKRPKRDRNPEITFRSGNEEYPDHDNALVISTGIANALVKRIMIDMRSSTDVLYLDAFQKLGVADKDLVSMTSASIGFTGDSISPLGMTTLSITVGEEPRIRQSGLTKVKSMHQVGVKTMRLQLARSTSGAHQGSRELTRMAQGSSLEEDRDSSKDYGG